MESSEDSFAWADTDISEISTENKESPKKKRKKHEETVNDHKCSDSSRKLSTEEVCANNGSTKKKKHKKKDKHDGEKEEDCIDYDDSFRNIKVKEESECFERHKSKKNKNNSLITQDLSEFDDLVKREMKKEKKKKKKIADDQELDNRNDNEIRKNNNSFELQDSFDDLNKLVKKESKSEKNKNCLQCVDGKVLEESNKNQYSNISLTELDDLVNREIKKGKKKNKKIDYELDNSNDNEIGKNKNDDIIELQESFEELNALVKKESKSQKKKNRVDCKELEKSNKKQYSNDLFSELDDLVNTEIKKEKRTKKAIKVDDPKLDESDEELQKTRNSHRDEDEEVVKNEVRSVGEVTKNNNNGMNTVNEKKSPRKQPLAEKNQLRNGDVSNDSDTEHSEDINNSINNNVSAVNYTVPNRSKLNENSGIQATPSILGRIRFENDDVEMLSDIDKSNCENYGTSEKLNKYIHKQNLHQLDVTSDESVITPNDEIWLIKCPQEVVLENFVGKNITLDNKCKLKLNGDTYCGTIADETTRITVMTSEENKFIIKNINVNGLISLKKRLPKPHIVEDNIMVNNSTDFIPLPETKCRHPLFGSNYLQSIKIAETVQKQLNSCSNTLNTDNSTKKKKMHKKHYDTDNETKYTKQTESSADTPALAKKPKKRKHSIEEDNSAKKRKKVKKDMNISDVWGSEQAIAENLFNF